MPNSIIVSLILLNSSHLHSILLNSSPLHSILLNSSPLHSILLNSSPLHSILLNSFSLHSILLISSSPPYTHKTVYGSIHSLPLALLHISPVLILLIPLLSTLYPQYTRNHSRQTQSQLWPHWFARRKYLNISLGPLFWTLSARFMVTSARHLPLRYSSQQYWVAIKFYGAMLFVEVEWLILGSVSLFREGDHVHFCGRKII